MAKYDIRGVISAKIPMEFAISYILLTRGERSIRTGLTISNIYTVWIMLKIKPKCFVREIESSKFHFNWLS